MVSIAEAMAQFLEAQGVELIVGQSLPSALHLGAEATSLRQIHVRTENAGTAICDGYARLAGRVALMTAQNGPAATLLVPGLAEALKASTPMVAIVQEVDAAHREKNAFQEFDHVGLFTSCSKWIGRLDMAERVYDFLNLALTHAVSGRPGPSVLLVPAGILLENAPPLPSRTTPKATYPLDRPVASADRLAEAAGLLTRASQPLIVAGGGVHASGAIRELERLQADHALPVATTLMGKGAVSEEHPLSLGVIGHLLGRTAPNREVRRYVEDADVVLFIGTRTNQNGTDSWTLLPSGARFIHIDIDGLEIGRNYESLRLVGDARATLGALGEALSGYTDPATVEDRKTRLARLIPRPRPIADCTPESHARGLRPERIVETITRLAPTEAILVADASYASAWLCSFGLARRVGQRFITPRGLAGLGWGLPLALGVALARPEVPVIAISGDGGFAHVWSELETAVRYRLPVVVIVLKNGVLGYQRDAEIVKFGRHTHAIPIGEIDHAAIARAVGCTGITVEEQDELEPALAEALTMKRPVLLDVRTDPTAFPPVTLLDALAPTDGAA